MKDVLIGLAIFMLGLLLGDQLATHKFNKVMAAFGEILENAERRRYKDV